MAPTSNAVLHQILEGVRDDVSELKRLFKEHDTWEKDFRADHAVVQASIARHEKEITELRQQVRDLADAVAPLIAANKVLVFIGSGLGVSVVALIWALITGQATISF